MLNVGWEEGAGLDKNRHYEIKLNLIIYVCSILYVVVSMRQCYFK